MAEAHLHCAIRTQTGKAANRRLRTRQDAAPGVIYGNQEAPVHVMMDQKKLYHACEHESFFSQVVKLDVAGKAMDVVVRDLQRHPFKQQVMHIDFMRVSQASEITIAVPLHFINEDTAPGVKQQGGKLFHELNEVEVSCLPRYLPEFIEVDVAALQLGESLHLSDLKLPKGITLTELGRGEEHNVAVVRITKAVGGSEDDDSSEATETSTPED